MAISTERDKEPAVSSKKNEVTGKFM